ncbi:MAG: hypothetical protein WC742_15245, partial [Gallionellaceae bacterium]
MNNTSRVLRLGITALGLAALLFSSTLIWAKPQEKSFEEMIKKYSLVPPGKPESEMLAKAGNAVNFIRKMELTKASKAINEALQLDTRNTYLHFLNGFIYHLQARQGDSQKNEMAIE